MANKQQEENIWVESLASIYKMQIILNWDEYNNGEINCRYCYNTFKYKGVDSQINFKHDPYCILNKNDEILERLQ